MAMSGPESRSGLVLELAEEFIDRYRRGERPPLREYTDRHPELAAEIREVFPAMAMMERLAIVDDSLDNDATGDAPTTRARAPEQLGDYRILREVGRGGMGVVYEAEQVSLGRHVALKVLPTPMIGDEKTRRRFEREAKAAAKLHHTNIVPVFGVGEAGDVPYYVMQFIRGQGLDAVLGEIKRLRAGVGFEAPSPAPASADRDATAADVARSLMTGHFDHDGHEPTSPLTATSEVAADTSASSRSASSLSIPGAATRGKARRESYWLGVARIAHQAADALAYAHGQGVVHRDIKPSNLLLDAAGTIWITDFGLAKASDQQDLTHTGDILGTLRYMPPEAFGGKVDARGDVYALGLTLYELLAFRPAFDEKERGRLVRQVTNDSPPPLRKLNPEVPRDLETIVQKAIERDPSHRYASAAELADDLRRFLDDEPIHARPLSPSERLARWARRNPVIAGLSGAVGALLLAIIAGLWYANGAAEAALGRESLLGRQASDRAVEAEKARKAAEIARTTSEAARKEADSARMTLADELYASRMNLVQTAFQAGNVARVTTLLDLERPRPGEPDRRGFEWHYWRRKANPEHRAWWQPGVSIGLFTMNSGMTFSADGRWLARAEAMDRGDVLAAVVREVETGKVVHRFRLAYEGPIDRAMAAIRFSAGGERLAAVWREDRIDSARVDLGVWDLASETELLRRTVEVPTRTEHFTGCDIALDSRGERVAWGFAIINDAGSSRAAAAIEGSRVLVDDVSTGARCLEHKLAEREWMRFLALTAGGERMVLLSSQPAAGDAIGRVSSRLIQFDLPGGRERPALAIGDQAATAMQLDPTGQRVACARMASGVAGVSDIQVRELESGNLVWLRDSAVGGLVTRLDFTPDGARLLVAGQSGFQVLDATADRAPLSEVRHPLNNRLFGAQAARFTREGRRVMGIIDGVIKEWDVPDPDAPLSGREYSDATTITVSPDGGLVALTSPISDQKGPAILVQEAATGRTVRRIARVSYDVTSVNVTPGDVMPADFDRPALFFSGDGSRVGLVENTYVNGSSGLRSRFKSIQVWETRSGRPLARLDLESLTRGEPPELLWTGSAAISADGAQLAVALTGYGPDVGTSAVLGGETLFSFGGPRSRVGKVVVADAASGTIVRTISDNGRKPLNLARHPRFSADGRFLVVAAATDAAPAVCVWDLRQIGPPRVLEMVGNANPEFLTISRDGRRLLGARRSAQRWVIESWGLAGPEDQSRQISWQGADIGGLALSPDGKRLAVLSGRSFQQGEVSLWDADSFRELATWSTGRTLPVGAVFTPDGRRLLVSTRRDVGAASPALIAFDAQPLDARLEAIALVQKLGAEEPLNGKVIEAVRAQEGYEPEVLREAERLAAERHEDSNELLRKIDLRPRLPVPLPRPRVEQWLTYTEEAARIAPGMPLAQTEHGRSLFALGRYAEAKEAYTRAIALDPKSAEPHAWLALCEARLGHRAEGLAAASRFVRNSRTMPAGAGVDGLQEALTSGLRDAFGPEALVELDRLAGPNIPK